MEGGHKPESVGGPKKLTKVDRLAPRASRKEHSLANTSILAKWDSFWISDLQYSKIINMGCFK